MALLLLLCLPALALAQSGDGYEMKRSKVAGGGGYTLIGGFSVPQCPMASAPHAEMIDTEINAKNRYVSILGGDAGRSQAIRLRFVDLPPPFDVWNFANLGTNFFVGEPFKLCENSGQTRRQVLLDQGEDCAPAGGLSREWFWAAPLVCDKGAANFMDWHGRCDGDTCVAGLNIGSSCTIDDDCQDVVHLYHEGLVPDGVYDVQAIVDGCSLQEESSYSTPLSVTQGKWGDVCGPGPGGVCTAVADGMVDITQDVVGLLDKFANINDIQKARADIEPGDNGINNGPDFKVNIARDVLFALEAFSGFPYPFEPGDPCRPG